MRFFVLFVLLSCANSGADQSVRHYSQPSIVHPIESISMAPPPPPPPPSDDQRDKAELKQEMKKVHEKLDCMIEFAKHKEERSDKENKALIKHCESLME